MANRLVYSIWRVCSWSKICWRDNGFVMLRGIYRHSTVESKSTNFNCTSFFFGCFDGTFPAARRIWRVSGRMFHIMPYKKLRSKPNTSCSPEAICQAQLLLCLWLFGALRYNTMLRATIKVTWLWTSRCFALLIAAAIVCWFIDDKKVNENYHWNVVGLWRFGSTRTIESIHRASINYTSSYL